MTYSYASGADVKVGDIIKVSDSGALYEVIQARVSPSDPRFISTTVRHTVSGHERILFISKTKEILIQDSDGTVTESELRGEEENHIINCAFPKRGWNALQLEDKYTNECPVEAEGRSAIYTGTRAGLITVAEILETAWDHRKNQIGSYDDYYSCKEAAITIRKRLAK